MASRSTTYVAALSVLGATACGVDVAGILSDAGLPVDTGTHAIPDTGRDGTKQAFDAAGDAPHAADATKEPDAKGGGDSGKDSGEKDAGGKDATGHDAGDEDSGEKDSGEKDSGEKDGAHEAAPLGDAARDAHDLDAVGDAVTLDAHLKDASSDAAMVTEPPANCFFSYSCGSSRCGCNQTCDDETSCGACLPGYASCTLEFHDCDTSLSGIANCGSCGNLCLCPITEPIPSCLPSGSSWECHCSGP